MPDNSTVAANVRLLQDGTPIPSTITPISTVATGTEANTYALQAIVVSDGTTTLAVVPTEAIILTGAEASDVLLSLTFLRIA